LVKIGNREFGIGILALIIIFSFILFGFTGVKVVGGAILLFFLPFYLILDNFDIEFGEKIVFSFFMGIGVFSIFVYYLGFVVNSIRVAIVVTFLLLVGVGLGLKKFGKS
jgi:hypothetical protein|tara:strand:+ start:214 stop:540 length:327 start_codon:yes stop_codon:yes gene_type:complete